MLRVNVLKFLKIIFSIFLSCNMTASGMVLYYLIRPEELAKGIKVNL
jgi:hypothetical protein